ncbi:hypothetical protein [Elioraea sp.]|uniref:hypothetical protein n=1 Tax=Elioraea sp. TaxID=2185103 RepID=UPI003F708FF3
MRRLLALLLLAGCGPVQLPFVEVPMPFERRPGATARDGLTRPPPARIVVPPSTTLGLPEEDARRFAASLAEALQAQELPVTAADIPRPDYRLLVAGETAAGQVRLTYTLVDAAGAPIGAAGGPRAVPAAAWSRAEDATFRAAAGEAASGIAAMLARADAASRRMEPDQLASRLPTVRMNGVAGAPGDGNRSLDRAIRSALAKEGVLVQEGAAEGEFALSGRVDVTALPRRQQRVEISWIVARADGTELGKVSQLNEVPAGTLDGLWADIALVVAEQAATGVAEVIRRARSGG